MGEKEKEIDRSIDRERGMKVSECVPGTGGDVDRPRSSLPPSPSPSPLRLLQPPPSSWDQIQSYWVSDGAHCCMFIVSSVALRCVAWSDGHLSQRVGSQRIMRTMGTAGPCVKFDLFFLSILTPTNYQILLPDTTTG